MIQTCNRHAIRVNINKPSKHAKRRKCLPHERLAQGKKHAGQKALLAIFTMSKTLQQRNTMPNCAGMKEMKAMNMLKQRRDNLSVMINL